VSPSFERMEWDLFEFGGRWGENAGQGDGAGVGRAQCIMYELL
jgi:hypothetical protein